MLSRKPNTRSLIYAVSFILAFVLAVLIVTGVISEASVLRVVALTLSLGAVFLSALARTNIAPQGTLDPSESYLE